MASPSQQEQPISLAKKRIGVIGAGVMGKAIIQGLFTSGQVSAKQVWATTKSQESSQEIASELGITATVEYEKLLAETDILILCVKPSGLPAILKQLVSYGLPASTLVISIVAGFTIEAIEAGLSGMNPVVRAMPNTPCVVRQGMTVVCGGTIAKKDHVQIAKLIFESVGTCIQLDEQHFDAVTGLSGSGPAYIFLMMEALADGGVRVGLPRNKALQIVTQTMLGAATMVKETGRHPAALRDDVTTPAGCTIGALLTMEDGKIRSVLARAVEEATRIASGLGDSRDSKKRK